MAFRSTWEYQWMIWVDMWGLVTTSGAPRSAGNQPCSADYMTWSTCDHRWQAWKLAQDVWLHWWQCWERQEQAREYSTSLQSSLGKTLSSLGTLQVHLEIIATTYGSTICTTHVFSVYSHLSIYIATHRHTLYVGWPKTVPERSLRCIRRWWLSEHWDTLQECDRGSLVMNMQAKLDRVWR